MDWAAAAAVHAPTPADVNPTAARAAGAATTVTVPAIPAQATSDQLHPIV